MEGFSVLFRAANNFKKIIKKPEQRERCGWRTY